MKIFPAPSKQAAQHILREMTYHERFACGSLHPRAGMQPVEVYSLQELYGLLNDTFPQIDCRCLGEWLQAVVQDPALADRVRETVLKASTQRERLCAVGELVGTRIRQCRQVLQGAAGTARVRS